MFQGSFPEVSPWYNSHFLGCLQCHREQHRHSCKLKCQQFLLPQQSYRNKTTTSTSSFNIYSGNNFNCSNSNNSKSKHHSTRHLLCRPLLTRTVILVRSTSNHHQECHRLKLEYLIHPNSCKSKHFQELRKMVFPGRQEQLQTKPKRISIQCLQPPIPVNSNSIYPLS